jgi:hypothetical protein
MPRERWFFARKGERRGPLAKGPLMSALVQEANPRAVLVWRRGFAEWTRAEDVPEIEERLRTLLGRPSAPLGRASGSYRLRPVAPLPAPPALAPARASVGRPILVGAGFGAVALVAVVAWQLTRPIPAPPPALPLGGGSVESAPAVVIPASPAESARSPAASPLARPSTVSPRATRAPALVADREADLPLPELRKLRGVAAWSGDTLKLTVVNGTGWRVTELSVRIGRFQGDDFVNDAHAVRLLPPAGAVDTGVADLLQRVAPDRRKPGLNPLDTGPFEGRAGAAPENYRWEIESARGYPPVVAPE